MTTMPRSPFDRRRNVRIALVLAGVALGFFLGVIVNHLPS